MATFLKEKELGDAYVSAEKTGRHWQQSFDEYERIVANLPSEALPPEYPAVTSGTTAALVDETPMRVWAQFQTGRVVALNNPAGSFEEWKTETTNVIWQNEIIPNANSQAPFFAKLQLALHKAITYGSQPAFTFKRSDAYYTGSDFILPNVRDVLLEPGKVSDTDSDYVWFNRHFTKLQLRTLIATAAKRPGHDGWDLQALKTVYDSDEFAAQDPDSLTAEQREVTDYSKVVTFSTCFNRGFGAPFYTIYRNGKAIADATVVRRQKNEDPTGDIPINFLYNRRNLSNPYGVSQIDLVGPTQNLVDFFIAAHARGIEKGIDPPIKVNGDVDTDGIKIDTFVDEPGALWEVGKGDAGYMNTSNAVQQSLPNSISMYNANIQNLQGTTDATISAGDAGNSRFSKTPAGVRYQQERTNSRDNYLRQRCDEFTAQLAKNLINTGIQAMHGDKLIEITEEQADKLRASGVDAPEDNMLPVAFDDLKKGEFKYEVDANSSIVKNDDDTKDRMVELLTTLTEVPNLDELMANDDSEIHLAELIRGIITKSGIEDVEKIITEISPEKKAAIEAQKQMAMQQAAGAVEGGEETRMEGVPEGEPIEGEIVETQEEPSQLDQLVYGLRARGWDDERIAMYLDRLGQRGEA